MTMTVMVLMVLMMILLMMMMGIKSWGCSIDSLVCQRTF
jgi:hypothetical protein